MNKIMLIAGCSHACGSEIETVEDSDTNRNKSFGNLVARQLGYTPVNIATGGGTNSSIVRSIIEWINENYDSNTIDLTVLVAWTESSRTEFPYPIDRYYHEANKACDQYFKSHDMFIRVNFALTGQTQEENDKIAYYQSFMAKNLEYTEIQTANLILQLEYFLKMKNIKYVMCETMEMFSDNKYIKPYINMIDKTYYMNFNNKQESFWWKYKSLGFVNSIAKYWHHGETPHSMFASLLHRFITDSKLG
jgi:hypothetical protein